MAGLMEPSRKPHNIPNKTPLIIEDQILYLRNKHPRWGAEKLLVLLEDRWPNRELPKISTIKQLSEKEWTSCQEKKESGECDGESLICKYRFL